MQLQTSALLKIKDLIEAILGKMNEISKPSRNFFGSVLDSWFVIPGRYTFSTLSRYGRYCDKSLRLQFDRGFDFVRYNRLLIRSKCGKELIAAFDPSFVPLLEAGLHVITKMRPDANLRYLYTGGKKKGRG
ncbi:hypothetical protein SAMN05216436_105243, partial [bacterium A37T11]